jgi:hypothetical protein
MIVSASRRTDIPAYYSSWLMGRIEAGYCLVGNPYDARRVTRVSLAPEDLDFIVLWTRDPRPMIPLMAELDSRGIRSYFQVTLTGYPSPIEPGAPGLDEATGALRDLAATIGPRRTLWRYDPIFVAGGPEGIGADWHRRNFERLARDLEGSSERVTLSLLDEYAATASRLARAGQTGLRFGSPRKAAPGTGGPSEVTRAATQPVEPFPALLADLASIARSRGMRPQACAEPFELDRLGIEAGACVDPALASSIWPGAGVAAEVGQPARPRKDSGQRGTCRCGRSVDIGSYGSCPRGCAYCYANRGAGKLLARTPADESL